ncbi:hypothetical protein H6G41_09260 [Tolypothrix sp. FACHB-123]|nr:hypothetical protein [Tolypothrix sp. FACHB-123]MBD2354812.1 hypothetical protein [Tolypothrix sp. FACHB-123]
MLRDYLDVTAIAVTIHYRDSSSTYCPAMPVDKSLPVNLHLQLSFARWTT